MHLMQVIHDCAPGIPAETMHAVVLHESAGNPYAVGLNGARLNRPPRTRAEAELVIRTGLAQGLTVDIGLGQVNSSHLRRYGLEAADLLDACWNLHIAATVLSDCYRRGLQRAGRQDAQSLLAQALSCYNTGDLNRGVRSGYAQAVYRAAARGPSNTALPTDVLVGWRSVRAQSGGQRSTAASSSAMP